VSCLLNAARVIVKGSLGSTHFYDSPAFYLQWPTVVDQTTTPPTPVTRLIAKRNAHAQCCHSVVTECTRLHDKKH